MLVRSRPSGFPPCSDLMALGYVDLPSALDSAFSWQSRLYRSAWDSIVYEEARHVYGPYELEGEERVRFLGAGTCVFNVEFCRSEEKPNRFFACWAAADDGNDEKLSWEKGFEDKPVYLVISIKHPDLDLVVGAKLVSAVEVVHGIGRLCLEVDPKEEDPPLVNGGAFCMDLHHDWISLSALASC